MQGTTVTFKKEGRKEGSFGEVCPVTVSFQAAAKIPHDSAEAVADLRNEAAVLAGIPPHRHIIGSFGLVPVPGLKDVLLLEQAEADLGELYKYDLQPAASMFMIVVVATLKIAVGSSAGIAGTFEFWVLQCCAMVLAKMLVIIISELWCIVHLLLWVR